MNQKDIESEAHKCYDQDRRNKFTNSVLDQDTRRSRIEEGNEESGDSSKRSRTTEEGEYFANPNPETPTSGGSTSQHPIGRDAAKKKQKENKYPRFPLTLLKRLMQQGLIETVKLNS
ncbi:hypothetical protein R6Q57_018402 [Mikania cordata]